MVTLVLIVSVTAGGAIRFVNIRPVGRTCCCALLGWTSSFALCRCHSSCSRGLLLLASGLFLRFSSTDRDCRCLHRFHPWFGFDFDQGSHAFCGFHRLALDLYFLLSFSSSRSSSKLLNGCLLHLDTKHILMFFLFSLILILTTAAVWTAITIVVHFFPLVPASTIAFTHAFPFTNSRSNLSFRAVLSSSRTLASRPGRLFFLPFLLILLTVSISCIGDTKGVPGSLSVVFCYLGCRRIGTSGSGGAGLGAGACFLFLGQRLRCSTLGRLSAKVFSVHTQFVRIELLLTHPTRHLGACRRFAILDLQYLVRSEDNVSLGQIQRRSIAIATVVHFHRERSLLGESRDLCLPLADGHSGQHN
mmetsp:Transcript_9432/g.16347  ORF Transcript_9432/g.16347 Transcript_9432/m.16347 type:complete len:360 (-) Transcript_9432:723-1802(-)